MLRKFVRYGIITVGALVGLVVVGGVALYGWTSAQISATRDLPTHPFSAPADAASVARGEHVLRALAKCADCHGEDLAGTVMVDDPAIGRLASSNLTGGRGGIGGTYSDADFERAIRHGLARDGRRLIVMPSMDYQHLSDADLGALIAYLRSVPPVDRETPPSALGPLARALFAAGKMPLFAADEIAHRDEVVASVPVDSTVAYGKYLGDVGCAGCHGPTYGGGKIPGAPPDFPPSANITPGGIGHYTYADFKRALTEGIRPGGTALHPMMPVQATKLMTEVEFVAVWKYLQSLEPKTFGSR